MKKKIKNERTIQHQKFFFFVLLKAFFFYCRGPINDHHITTVHSPFIGSMLHGRESVLGLLEGVHSHLALGEALVTALERPWKRNVNQK